MDEMATKFPPVEMASPEGLLALGGELSSYSLLTAYRNGIFPWPLSEENILAWFSPDPRGVLYSDRFHISRSLHKQFRKKKFRVTCNQQFSNVIRGCSEQKRKDQDKTWITEKMIEAYIKLHYSGHAYSIEVTKEEQLVGGMYGVNIGQFFSWGIDVFFGDGSIKSGPGKTS